MNWKPLAWTFLSLLAAACAGPPATDGPAPDSDGVQPVQAASSGAQDTGTAVLGTQGERPMGMGPGPRAGMRQGQERRQGQGQGMQHGHGQGMQHGGMGMGPGAAPAAQRDVPEELAEGARLFDYICSQCHTVDPPPNLAPPMTHVARHLRQRFSTEDEAVAFILSFVPAPTAEASVMPAMAVERFGLMPPLPLPPELLTEVARYVWFLGS